MLLCHHLFGPVGARQQQDPDRSHDRRDAIVRHECHADEKSDEKNNDDDVRHGIQGHSERELPHLFGADAATKLYLRDDDHHPVDNARCKRDRDEDREHPIRNNEREHDCDRRDTRRDEYTPHGRARTIEPPKKFRGIPLVRQRVEHAPIRVQSRIVCRDRRSEDNNIQHMRSA